MIDIENIVITAVKNALRDAFGDVYPNLPVYSYPIEVPESFPCVTLVESDNYTYRGSQEFGRLRENHANVTFTVNVYANNANGKKKTAKAIFAVVDNTLQDLKLTRIMATQVENIDRTIARYAGRYEGVVGEGITITDDGEEVVLFPMFRS